MHDPGLGVRRRHQPFTRREHRQTYRFSLLIGCLPRSATAPQCMSHCSSHQASSSNGSGMHVFLIITQNHTTQIYDIAADLFINTAGFPLLPSDIATMHSNQRQRQQPDHNPSALCISLPTTYCLPGCLAYQGYSSALWWPSPSPISSLPSLSLSVCPFPRWKENQC